MVDFAQSVFDFFFASHFGVSFCSLRWFFAAFLLNYYLLLLQSATAAWQIDAIFQFASATKRAIVRRNKYINGAAAAPTLELQSAFPTLLLIKSLRYQK